MMDNSWSENLPWAFDHLRRVLSTIHVNTGVRYDWNVTQGQKVYMIKNLLSLHLYVPSIPH